MVSLNDRGWARGLLTNEDNALLNRRLGEIFHENSKYVRTTLADGTVVLDLNNKMLLVSGKKLGEEVIHGVVAISAPSEGHATWIKEALYNDAKGIRLDKYSYAEICESLQIVFGEAVVRYYNGADYSYHKGQHNS